MLQVQKWPFFQTFFFRQYRQRKMSFTLFQNKKKPFQAIETRSSKSRKIDIFPRGLNHGFGPKIALFPKFFFQAIQARKMSFTIFYNDKTPFYAIKCLLRYSKSRKSDIFPKGLTHSFGPKMAIFANSFFQAYLARKMAFTTFQNKKKPFQALKTTSTKSRKIDIFSKGVNPWFRSKNGHFSKLFFLGNTGEENVFYDILEQKKAFLGDKNKKFKNSKN